MPSNMPNRDWRGGQSSPAKTTARSWRKPGKSEPRRPWSKNSKRAGALAALAGLAALLVVIITYLQPPRPTLLVLQGSPFDTNLGLPTDVYGWKTLLELKTVADKGEAETNWFTWRRGNLHLAGTGPAPLTADWLQGNSWYSDEQNVLMYLATHGGTDKDGAFLFYENGAQGIERLRIRDLLDRFKDKALAKKTIILLLDATQIDACPGQGLLYNDFARQLKAEVDESKLPNLLVLCSSSPDQKSWVSDEWQQSVFGHYVVEALRGACASDSKITVANLRDYVRKKVMDWVADNRDAVQEPFLIGDEKRSGETVLRQVTGQASPEEGTGEDKQDGVPATMTTLWKEHQDLAAAIPSPAVYSPYLWRRYRDTLIRYEELLRAGDPTGAASKLRENLSELKGQITIERQRFQLLESLASSLPMSATLGVNWPSPSDPAALTQLKRAFSARMESPSEKTIADFAAQRKTAPNDNVWRVATERLLLDDVMRRLGDPESKSADVLKLAEERLGLLEGMNPGVRPVEAHLLSMLSRYAVSQSADKTLCAPPADLLLALQVCRQAETTALAVDPKSNTHPYSEQVYPWIKGQVEQADVDRRDGENRVFGSTVALWQEGRGYLEKAKAKYEHAAVDAATVRSALDLRDHAEADLPYYTAWLARRSRERDWSEAETKTLWENVHRLDDLLRRPGTETLHPTDGSESLGDVAQRTAKSLQKLEHDVFSAEAAKLAEEIPVQSQSQRQDIADLLSVPLVPASERVRLLTKLRLSSGELIKGTEKNAAARADAEQTHLSEACRQGQLAFAILGGTKDQLADLNRSLTPLPDKDRTRANLNEASGKLATAWQSRAGSVRKDIEDALRQKDAAQALPLVSRADRTSRLLDGAASVAREPFLPADGFRRANMQGLLLWLAQRTANDHWWGDHPNDPTPYYKFVGKALLDDADTIAKQVEQRRDILVTAWKRDAEKWEDRLFKNVTRLHVEAIDAVLHESGKDVVLKPPELTITSEGTFDVAYRIQADQGMPPDCTPLVWLGGNNKGEKIQAVPQDAERKLVTLSGAQPMARSYTVTHTLTEKQDGTGLENDAAPPTAPLVYHAFFRGQPVDSTTRVTFYLKADTVAYHYPPKTQMARIAAVGDKDVAEGTIAIVLDCSGSMGVEGYTRDSICKYTRAIQALRTVLYEVPPSMKVGVWLFGQKKRKDSKPLRDNEPYAAPKQLSSHDDVDALMDRLLDETPEGVSPILHYMLAAKESLIERTPTGLRTLLVLTDGDDNQFGGDNLNAAQRNELIRERVLQEFRGGEISVSMLLFHTDDPQERANAKAQFDVLNDLPQKNGLWFDTDFGKRFSETAQKDLLTRLRNALRPRLELYHNGSRQETSPFVHFSRPNEPQYQVEWSELMKAGAYQAQLYRQIPTDLQLEPDDQLLIRLQRANPNDRTSPVTLLREICGWLPQYETCPSNERDGWLATVIDSRLSDKKEGFVDVLFTVENTRDRGAHGLPLRQIRPAFTWVEVQPKGSKPEATPPDLHWGNLNRWGNLCAPAWDLWLPNWPFTPPEEGHKPRQPRLRIWALSSELAARIKQVQVHYEPDGSGNLHKLRGTQDLPGERVIIDDVKEEPHDVVVGKEPNGTPTRARKNCLVVRLRYTGDDPIWVDLLDHSGGSEHSFYRKARVATVLFWDDGDKAASLATGTKSFILNLQSISSVKSIAPALEPPNISVLRD